MGFYSPRASKLQCSHPPASLYGDNCFIQPLCPFNGSIHQYAVVASLSYGEGGRLGVRRSIMCPSWNAYMVRGFLEAVNPFPSYSMDVFPQGHGCLVSSSQMDIRSLLNPRPNETPKAVTMESNKPGPRRLQRRTGNFGKLSLLPTMPLDILFVVRPSSGISNPSESLISSSLQKICSHLPPKSLLALTRTNHMFRTTLLSRSSTTIWLTMRRNQDILSPMMGVSEPEWARLLFGGTCCQVSHPPISHSFCFVPESLLWTVMWRSRC